MEDTTCGSFIQCSKGTPFVINCPRRSQVYDPDRKICVRSFEYECPREGSGKTTKRATTVRTSTTTARPPSTTTTANKGQPSKQKIVCYYPNWAYYRKGTYLHTNCKHLSEIIKDVLHFSGNAKHIVNDLDAKMCTHLLYSFATLDTKTYEMKVFDKWLDIDLKNCKYLQSSYMVVF